MTQGKDQQPPSSPLWEAAVIVFWTLGAIALVVFLVVVPLTDAWRTGEIQGRQGAVHDLATRPGLFTATVVYKLLLGALVVGGVIVHVWFAGTKTTAKPKDGTSKDGAPPRP
jgi:hypothetical protein